MDNYCCRLQYAAVASLWTYFVLSMASTSVSACPTAVPKACRSSTCYYSIATLDRIVQEATYNPASEKIHLVFERGIPSAMRSLVQVVRVDSGDSASFPCAVLNVTYSTPLQLPDVFWMHNQRPLALLSREHLIHEGILDLQHSVQSRPSSTSVYADTTVTLTMKNVSWNVRGNVTCSQPCLAPFATLPAVLKPGDVPFCSNEYQYFHLLVFPSASELFRCRWLM
ncbi:uncharacterized protein LOC129598189 isoform X1 [Paramacrobiotus metropolitanus]|uniref:uncharacterized protein LOC129598189 isoform X1 n=1 Tax=Paramacrobiotus metropolitanus TaxID=2943436 RepID=UPI002445F284|nr:uncharacterized protein LOC129598189 isoform X1 [Paramacrobiotus metropolitanus]